MNLFKRIITQAQINRSMNLGGAKYHQLQLPGITYCNPDTYKEDYSISVN